MITANGWQAKRVPGGWAVLLTDPYEVRLMGTEWLPLPLTEQATEQDVRDHLNRLEGK